ncbi:HlyD family efflux transporter periplasmic adaptor subunit [Methylococcus capsulatus]|uniref:HlyD family secretion protein n=2 Tax=Methylococcus TaxID=413 RepID=A0ABZ2F2X8_METCP|nr:HlyD family secretion protein [Methylococcus capsulatus]MDF9391699.1 HlyD family secretion protein [Methylococcus capsulatus]
MKVRPKEIRARRNRRLLAVFLLLLLTAATYAVYFWLDGRFWVTTDNAFIAGNLIPVEADATGIVTQVLVEESQYVRKGDLLVRLDEHRAAATLGRAQGNLARVLRRVAGLFARRQQMCQRLAARAADLERVRHDLIRYREAVPSGSVSEQVLQNAEDHRRALEAEVREARAELLSAEAQVGGTTRRGHPDVEVAKNNFIEAFLEYNRQHIVAPATGYVAKRKAQVGDRVKPGDPLMTIVPLDHLWVEANLRETDMRRVRPGQRALIVVDVYGKSHTLHGKVEGLVPGTGSVFALLPPDNATGNFIHIVQRVPVRITLQKEEIQGRLIRPGLSTITSIDVREPGSPPDTSYVETSAAEYATDIFADELTRAESMAREILEANLPEVGPIESPCPTLAIPVAQP